MRSGCVDADRVPVREELALLPVGLRAAYVPVHPVRRRTGGEHGGWADLAVLALVQIRRRIREGHAGDGRLAPVAGPGVCIGSHLVAAGDAVELVVI